MSINPSDSDVVLMPCRQRAAVLLCVLLPRQATGCPVSHIFSMVRPSCGLSDTSVHLRDKASILHAFCPLLPTSIWLQCRLRHPFLPGGPPSQLRICEYLFTCEAA